MASTNKFIQPGLVLELTAPTGGVTAGVPVLIGTRLVIPTTTVAETLLFRGMTAGVFSVPKVGSQAWTEGALVYWDDSNKYFTTTAGGNTLIGAAVEAVASGAGDTVGKVRFN